ncbi:MAG: hypothetical protein HZB53_05770 [Chloroflexi bacterium]|nr:hypothetical protein [Chloroflexota bacterium]
MTAPAVHSVMDRYRGFAVVSSLGFACLYAELAAFMHATNRVRPDGEAWLLAGAIFVVAAAGHLASFAPAREFTIPDAMRQASLVLPELTSQLGKGVGVVLVTGVLCGAITLYLAGFDATPAYSILNNTYVFVAAGGVLLHCAVTYVRYGALLYAVKQDSYVKVIAASGLLALIILGAFAFMISLDIAWLGAAPAALHGLYGLHVYGRDLFFFTLVVGIYGWHLRWMSDH